MIRGKRNIILDECRDKIINLYNSGCTQQDIADMFNVHQGTIGKRLNKWNVIDKINIDSAIIKKMYVEDCYTCRDISVKFNVSTSCINGRLHTMGIYSKDIDRPFVRTSLRIDIPKSILKDLYINEKLTMKEIANRFHCSRSVVSKRLKEYGLKSRNNIEAANRGSKHHNYNKPMSKESKYKLIKSLSKIKKSIKTYGKGNGDYYATPNQGKKWMRSGWEIKVANYLTEKGYEWYYEYEWLNIGDIYYIPDFYLSIENRYIEVKGWKTKKTMYKYNIAKNIYNIELWDYHKMKELGIPTR